jgi:hypothetical protein
MSLYFNRNMIYLFYNRAEDEFSWFSGSWIPQVHLIYHKSDEVQISKG